MNIALGRALLASLIPESLQRSECFTGKYFFYCRGDPASESEKESLPPRGGLLISLFIPSLLISLAQFQGNSLWINKISSSKAMRIPWEEFIPPLSTGRRSCQIEGADEEDGALSSKGGSHKRIIALWIVSRPSLTLRNLICYNAFLIPILSLPL